MYISVLEIMHQNHPTTCCKPQQATKQQQSKNKHRPRQPTLWPGTALCHEIILEQIFILILHQFDYGGASRKELKLEPFLLWKITGHFTKLLRQLIARANTNILMRATGDT